MSNPGIGWKGRTRFGWVLLGLCLLSSLVVLSKEAPRGRIVAVGDVHGNLAGFRAILEAAEVVDSSGQWIGGRTTLVQVGDMLDRGPDDRAVLDFIIGLEKKADKARGEVIALLGNHEAMNVIGDLRYVTAESFAAFSDKKSEKRRRDYLKRVIQLERRKARRAQAPEPAHDEDWKSQWMKSHPLGYVEHRKAMGPGGQYGKWIRKLPAIVRLGDLLFLHGGISPDVSALSVKKLNRRIGDELRTFDSYRVHLRRTEVTLDEFSWDETFEAVQAELELLATRPALKRIGAFTSSYTTAQEHMTYLQNFLQIGKWMSVHPDGPLWFRGYAFWSESENALTIDRIAKSYGVSHLIVGHTPQLPGQIKSRFGGMVFLIDTGLNTDFYQGGAPTALEIENGRFTAVTLKGRKVLVEPRQLVSAPDS